MRKSALCSLFGFSDDVGKLFLRIVVAVAIFPHGAQKVLGIFGGNGLDATWKFFTETLHITPVLAGAAIAVEFLAPLFLLLGLFTRAAAVALAALMFVAMQYHTANGFFLNWTGTQAGEGVEYHLLFLGAAIALVLFGGGRFSLLSFSRKCSCAASDDVSAS